jgi:SpoVK/Ycf46/Vps4 family AAA+-type ATPase
MKKSRKFTKRLKEFAISAAPEGDPQKRQFTLLREQYLPSLELQPGFTLIHSPKGTGKTEALKALIETCHANNLSVGLIGHRHVALRALSQQLNLAEAEMKAQRDAAFERMRRG